MLISPSERIGHVQSKVDDYLTYGTEQVWCIYPDKERIVVHFPNWTTKAYNIGDAVPGNDLLSGFLLEVAKVFGK